LDNGINVYTTLNVQHLESRADAVEKLAGVQVKERVPDTVLEWADEIEMIDISPDSLRHRLAEGKVYMGNKAVTAANAFFTERNLAALREMTLRSTAERVNLDLLKTLKQERRTAPLPTGERIMVAVGPSPYSNKLIRWTKRYASTLNATWVVVHVELSEPLDNEARERLNSNLQLARTLGAEIVTTSGDDVPEMLIKVARRELVTQIVVGRSPKSWFRNLAGGSFMDRLISESGSIAVHVVPSDAVKLKFPWQRVTAPVAGGLKDYFWALSAPVALGALCYLIRQDMGHFSVALLFLAATILGGFYLTRGAVMLMSVLSVFIWNFFFVSPQFTLFIHSRQDVLLFFLFLLVGLTMGQLTARLHALNQAERRREIRSYALYKFLDCLNGNAESFKTFDESMAIAREITGCAVNLVLSADSVGGRRAFPSDINPDVADEAALAWMSTNRDIAGSQTQNLPDLAALYIPVESGEHFFGALRVETRGILPHLATRDLLMQMARLLGRFTEREALHARVERMQILEASQRLQKTLLDTVSHELKTPLTVIMGTLERLLQSLPQNEGDAELLRQAERSARRLNRNVNMLLDLTRFESGVIKPKFGIIDVSELFSKLRSELAEEFSGVSENLEFTSNTETFFSDEPLIFQLLIQLLRNAIGHTPAGTRASCRIEISKSQLHIRVNDSGSGLPEDTEKLFEAFCHGAQKKSKGLGLGLSIAKRISETLGGNISAVNAPEGGACFSVQIPIAPNNI